MPLGGTVLLEAHREGTNVDIDVHDQGGGIDEENMEKIFDPFFTTKESGTGLGLSVAHQIVSQHRDTDHRPQFRPRRNGSRVASSPAVRNMTKGRILVVDDDPSLRRVLQVQLEQEGYEVAVTASAQQTLSVLQLRHFDLVITDLKMPGMSGLELLKQARLQYPQTIIIMLTAFGTVDTAVEAMKVGAYDYLTKPVHADELSVVVRHALEHLHLVEQVRTLRLSLNKKYGFENILGRSDALLEVLDMAERAAHSNSTVLIRGETGTGKELLARAIHFNSSRSDNPLVTINCGAIPKELLESELFGHKRGAFTGAVVDKKGRIELADRGTLFLDEIAEMSPDLQVKLLRLVQEGEIEKVGSEAKAKVNVRIIAATHRDLQVMIEDGTSRGLILSPRSNSTGDAAIAGTIRRHSGSGPSLFPQKPGEERASGSGNATCPVALFRPVPLAGQRARTGECCRAHRGSGARKRYHHRGFTAIPAAGESASMDSR
jgi:CheY-like chemotaxis protein